MLSEATGVNCHWLSSGGEVFPEMLAAIEAAQQSICLEVYIYSGDELGKRFREALVRARQRGVRVRVLYDALGSMGLSASFWNPLRTVGGEVRQFNPLSLHRLGIRDHRKILVCDERLAFIGGFNISDQYDGDGISRGWCDLGLKIDGILAEELVIAFEEMFALADFRHATFVRLRSSAAKKTILAPHEQLLLSGPGRGLNPFKRALRHDLRQAREVLIVNPYFLPSWRIRRALFRIPRRGGKVKLLLPGKSDVVVSRLAAQSLYRRFLNEGVEIFEYQPQILHAKLILIDDIVYAGSANLDPRSLNINYELMIRFDSQEKAGQARAAMNKYLAHSRQVTPEEWAATRSFWQRLQQRWAYFLLVRLDPLVANWQWRRTMG